MKTKTTMVKNSMMKMTKTMKKLKLELTARRRPRSKWARMSVVTKALVDILAILKFKD